MSNLKQNHLYYYYLCIDRVHYSKQGKLVHDKNLLFMWEWYFSSLNPVLLNWQSVHMLIEGENSSWLGQGNLFIMWCITLYNSETW